MDKQQILSNKIVKSVIWAVIIVIGLTLASSIFLTVYTHHNKSYEVPDLSGLTVRQAARTAVNNHMHVEVVDSIYIKRMPKGAVVRQEPRAGAQVKKGRRIQLTINAITPKKVPMPNLVGYSLRSACAELASRGLELGRIMYVSDMATNNVLRQLWNNNEIEPGTMIPGETGIDLVLGLNPGDNTATRIPNLIGKHWRTAIDRIHENSLNVGNIVFDKDIRSYKDSANAVVYRQSPAYELVSTTMGRTISIYLTLDAAKIPENATIEK